jgi:hypothetical protein
MGVEENEKGFRSYEARRVGMCGRRGGQSSDMRYMRYEGKSRRYGYGKYPIQAREEVDVQLQVKKTCYAYAKLRQSMQCKSHKHTVQEPTYAQKIIHDRHNTPSSHLQVSSPIHEPLHPVFVASLTLGRLLSPYSSCFGSGGL